MCFFFHAALFVGISVAAEQEVFCQAGRVSATESLCSRFLIFPHFLLLFSGLSPEKAFEIIQRRTNALEERDHSLIMSRLKVFISITFLVCSGKIADHVQQVVALAGPVFPVANNPMSVKLREDVGFSQPKFCLSRLVFLQKLFGCVGL